MRRYETIYIVDPTIKDEDHQGVIKKFQNLIEKEKGVFIKVNEWGKQRLAYEIRNFDKGSYILMDYCGNSGITAKLERDLKLDDRVLKYQTVKLADKVDPQELMSEEQEAKKESEIKEDQALEKETAAQKDDIASSEEVENGL
ncbi:MAG: 30S ribosomal protein S6 [Desulfobacteraceae bacterium]|nr:30S ribosomal protein S6 [Desulfobacteraceae bacterium]